MTITPPILSLTKIIAAIWLLSLVPSESSTDPAIGHRVPLEWRGSREESVAAYQAALAWLPSGLPESRRSIAEQIRRVGTEPLDQIAALRNLNWNDSDASFELRGIAIAPV
jgi:hypothetical protein